MSTNRKIPRVPEANEIAEPTDWPVYTQTPAQEQALRIQIRAALKKRYWKAGQTYKCLACGKRTMKGTDDLQFEIPRGNKLIVYRRLRGAQCPSCGAKFVETGDWLDIEGDNAQPTRPDFEAKVTTIGRGSLGTYWPADVVRNLGLHKGERAYIEILGRKTALVTFR